MENMRIVITGLGPLASTGIGKEAFWDGIINHRIGLKLEEININGENWDKYYMHRINDFNIDQFGINQDVLDDVTAWKEGEEIIDLHYLIAAVKLALDDSKLQYDRNDNNIGLVLTHENPGLEQFFTKILDGSFDLIKEKSELGLDMKKKQFFESLYQKNSKSAYDLQTFMFLFHISKIFGIHGYSLFINNACASGLYALEAASQMIRSGKNSTVIVAGSDYPGIYKYFWFKKLGIYAEDGKIKPFSKDSKGLVFGDGGSGIVLEELDHALKRKAHIYAEYLGGGFSQEGWKANIPYAGSNFFKDAIMQAVATSNIEKEDIDLVCAHGVGNFMIDKYEAKTITDVFGTYTNKPLVTAFKPYIGHTLGVSSLVETVISALCLDNKLIIPSLNTETVDSKIGIGLVKEKINMEFNILLKICCAFAGYNAAVILKKYNA